MKNLFTILFISLFIFSCGEKNNNIIEKKKYYENGQVKDIKYYKNESKRFFKRIVYYENGQIKKEGNYKKGIPHGKVVEFYKNGQLEIEKNYDNGKNIDPIWTQYYKNTFLK